MEIIWDLYGGYMGIMWNQQKYESYMEVRWDLGGNDDFTNVYGNTEVKQESWGCTEDRMGI